MNIRHWSNWTGLLVLGAVTALAVGNGPGPRGPRHAGFASPPAAQEEAPAPAPDVDRPAPPDAPPPGAPDEPRPDRAREQKRAGRGQPVPPAALECSVIPLQHANCRLVTEALRDLFEHEGHPHKVTTYERLNAVIVRATPPEVEQMTSIVTLLDVPQEPRGEAKADPLSTEVLPLKYTVAADVTEVVQRIYTQMPGGRHGDGSPLARRVTCDERTNSLIVHGTRAERDVVRKLVEALDAEPGTRKKSDS